MQYWDSDSTLTYNSWASNDSGSTASTYWGPVFVSEPTPSPPTFTLSERRAFCATGWSEYLSKPVLLIYNVIHRVVKIRDRLCPRGIGCRNFRRVDQW